MEKKDRLWPGGLEFYFDDALFQPSTDSFLLGSYPKLKKNSLVCDLGAGTGLIGLLLLAREPSLHLTDVEIQSDACALCRKNIELNHLDAQICVIEGDLRETKHIPNTGRFDLVVANPPYFAEGHGLISPDQARSTARSELAASLQEICQSASRLLKSSGSFCMVFRTDRLVELLETLRSVHLEPKRLRFVQNTAQSAPSLLLLEARKDGKPSITVEAPLILRNSDGSESDEYRRIYFRDKE